MSKIENLFLELVQVAIGNRISLSHSPSADEWGELYSISKKQSLVGVCFAGVQKLQTQSQEPPEMIYLTWMGMAAKIQQRNEVVNRQCVELQAKLSADGFKSCILKGQGVASLYSEHLRALRQSGDIDVWLDGSWRNVMNYVNSHTPNREFDFKHAHLEFFEDTDVELHVLPVKRYNPRRNRLLKTYFDSEVKRQCANRQSVDGQEISVPTVDFQLVHQLLHVYNHYVYEGVGLRQIMDLYFTLRATYYVSNYSSTNNENEYYRRVVELFKKLGLIRFVAASQWLLKEVFLIPDEELLCTPDEKEGRQMLDEILEGGNFGHYSERNRVNGESTMARMWRRMGQSLRMVRYDLLGLVCAPWYRLRIELWRRHIGRKYNV